MNSISDKPFSILLADDHALFLDALVAYIQRVAPAARVVTVGSLDQVGAELDRVTAAESDYDIVLIDWHMPGVRSIDDLRALVRANPDGRFALMSGVVRPHDVWQIIEAGFLGYIPKTLSGAAMVDAIRRILAGETYIPMDPETMALFQSYKADRAVYMPPTLVAHDRDPGLTQRERESLVCLARGQTNQEIANDLGVSVATVKMHLRHAFEKMGVRNRTEAVLKCREMGIGEAG